MFVEPPCIVERTPLLLPIVATVVLLLDQVPPAGVPVSVWVVEAQLGDVKLNEGTEFTVCIAVVIHPAVLCVYEIIVVPAEIDVTFPPEFIVAIALSELLHVYPVLGVPV